VSLDDDPRHCGACGRACSAQEVCAAGACTDVCALAGKTSCAGTCVDLLTDVAHCGACGIACPAGAVCAAGACAAPRCAGDVGLAGLPDVLAEGTPEAVAVADLDLDGIPDLVVADYAAANILVVPGLGQGGFGAPRAYAVSPGPFQVAIADMNGDGRPDVVVLSYGNPGTLAVLLTGPDGTLSAPVVAPVAYPTALAVADFTGDGTPDVVVLEGIGQVRVFPWTGTGFGTPVAHAVPDHWSSNGAVAAADVDGDGFPDAIVAQSLSLQVYPNLGDGTGALGAPTSYARSDRPQAVAASDVDRDGLVDVVLVEEPGDLVVFRNTGGGVLAPAEMVPIAQLPRSLALGDLDGDGLPDAVVGSWGQSLSVLQNRGGTFGPEVRYPIPMATSVAIADLDADGRNDVVATSRAVEAVLILLNQGGGTLGPPRSAAPTAGAAEIVAGDFDGDGIRDLVLLELSTSERPSRRIAFFRGMGGATFAAPVYQDGLADGFGPAVAGDLDGDGRDDLVILHQAGQLGIARGSPGGLGPESLAYFITAYDLALDDVDGDGRLDVLATARVEWNPALVVFPGNGDGSLGPPRIFPYAGYDGARLMLGDFDGNGQRDLLLYDDRNLWLFRKAAGGLAAPVSEALDVAGYVSDLVAGDLDGDGRADLAVVTRSYSPDETLVRVLLRSDLGFSRAASYPVSRGTGFLALADISGAGHKDLVTGNSSRGTIGLLLSLGGGAYGPERRWMSGVAGTQRIAVADLDGDLRADVAAAGAGWVAIRRASCLP
jgi:hypothetical protein